MSPSAFTIYNASAGAGKTFTLAKEYIKILVSYPTNDAYKYILAVTFTNKAVKEMKERIVDNLQNIAYLSPSDNNTHFFLGLIAKETGKSKEWVQNKCRNILYHLIHNYSGFAITTIDKFTQQIVRSFAPDLGLSHNFDVNLDEVSLTNEAVDVLLQRIGSDVTEEDKKLTEIFLQFSKSKAQRGESWDISKELYDVGKLIISENNIEKLEPYAKRNLSDFSSIKKIIQDKRKKATEVRVKHCEYILNYLTENELTFEMFTRSFYPKHILKISQLEANEVLGEIKEYNKPEKIKGNKKSELFIHPHRDFLVQQTDFLYQLIGRESLLLNIEKQFNSLALTNEVYKTFKTVQNEQNLVSISEFNKILNKELKDQPAAYIYERIGEKFRHFFIDEFQDTSIMQWENMLPLIDNALSGRNEFGKEGTAMVVGDPKQSIYRFRGGDVNQFINVSNESVRSPFVNPDKKVEHLATNYRSFSEVIDFNNRFFKQISSVFRNEDYQNLYNKYSSQNKTNKTGGFVSISLTNAVEKEEINEYHLERTKEIINKCKLKGYRYDEIAIICRKNKDSQIIGNYLVEHNIDILSSESLLLNQSVEVQLIIQFLELIKNNENQDSKALLLYLLTEKLGKKDQQHNVLFEAIREKKAVTESDIEKILQQFSVNFKFDIAKTLPLFSCVEYIIETVIQPISAIVNNAYIQYFLDFVLEQNQTKNNSLINFLDVWDNKSNKLSIPSPKGINAVQLSTIHKSKGLEYPVVIYPFADTNLSMSRETFWIPTNTEEAPEIFVNYSEKIGKLSEESKKALDKKNDDFFFDLVNVFYVAFTRAKHQLYIISSKHDAFAKKENKPKKLSAFFIDFLENENMYNDEQEEFTFGEMNNLKTEPVVDNESSSLEININQDELKSKNEIKIATQESLMWESTQAQAIEEGNIIHEILRTIETIADVEFAIKKVVIKGLIKEEDVVKIRERINKVVLHPELTEFFNTNNKIISETALLKKGEQTIIPDRMAINGNTAFLLDYKTGGFKESHKKQVEQYASALEEMDFKVKKKLIVFIQTPIKIIHL